MSVIGRILFRSSLVLLCAVPSFPGAPARALQDAICPEQRFEEEFERARAFTVKGEWDRARAAWLRLLDDHAGAAYVVPRLQDAREGLRNATFWAERQRPDEQALVEGKLQRYDRSNGRLSIEYGPGQHYDFEKVDQIGPALWLHPAVFKGPYEIVIEARAGAFENEHVLFGLEGERRFQLDIGLREKDAQQFYLHVLRMLDGMGTGLLERAEPKETGRDEVVEVEISVSPSTVRVSYDGKQVFRVKNEHGLLGRFGLEGSLRFEKLSIQGSVTSAWIEGLVDRALLAEREAFEQVYRDPAVFAAWRTTGGTVPKRSRDLTELTFTLPFPDRFTPEQTRELERVRELVGAGNVREAEECLAAARELPEATRRVLLGMLASATRRYASALEHIDASVRLGPGNLALEELRLELLIHTENVERAIDGLSAWIEDGIGAELGNRYLRAELFLLTGNVAEARADIEAGLAAAPHDEDLLELRSQIVKADQGPPWLRPLRVEGRGFTLVCETDSRALRAAEREISDALDYYQQRLGPLPGGASVRAWLFGGEAGYLRYIEGVEATSAEATAGIYSPRLRQILVWNQPDEADVLHALRHECMHAYLHQRVGAVPTWLDEGLAEFYAAARDEKRRWKPGTPSEKQLALLAAGRWQLIPLAQFLYLDHATFMANASACYPQAWAFVDFLHGNAPAARGLLDGLLEELEGRVDECTAVDAALAGVDLAALEQAFRLHVLQMASAGLFEELPALPPPPGRK